MDLIIIISKYRIIKIKYLIDILVFIEETHITD